MSLARDEVLGLVVAGVVGAAALANFAYRELRGAPPETSTPAAGPPAAGSGSTAPEAPVETPEPAPPPAKPAPPAPPSVATEDARAALATALEAAFVADGSPARVIANGTTLDVRWEMCSKQMLRRLLHDDDNFQVKNVRAATGLSVAMLKARGFKRITCDDGRKGLKPASRRL